MKIIIKEANRNLLKKELDEVQKRTTARNINVDDLFIIIKAVESRLGIAKDKMIGISADVDYNAQVFASNYKYSPESTQVVIKKTSSGWALTKVYRNYCRRPSKKYKLTLSDTAKDAILESKECFGD